MDDPRRGGARSCQDNTGIADLVTRLKPRQHVYTDASSHTSCLGKFSAKPVELPSAGQVLSVGRGEFNGRGGSKKGRRVLQCPGSQCFWLWTHLVMPHRRGRSVLSHKRYFATENDLFLDRP
jgi:hypothetical protein